MQQCPSCGCHTLKVRGVNCNLGMVCRLETFCTSCDNVISSTLSSDRLDSETSGNVPFVVTRSVVSASIDMGVGHTGIVKLCRYLDMDAMHHTTFGVHRQAVSEASKEVATNILSDAVKTVRRVYQDLDPSIGNHDDINLTVSFDGSWMTRGHKSVYGVGCVVEVITGLVLDLTVLSLYCQSCACASAKYGGNNTAAFQQWHASHTDCNRNYSGSSGGMEATAAEILWNRSGIHDFRYTTLLSDGDAKTFTHLCSLNVYGEDVSLVKEECINHVAKRLGTALRKLSTQSN